MTTVVFSRDRAMQLEAFLRSYSRFVQSTEPVHVLWHTTDSVHAQAYADVFTMYPWARPVKQTAFKADLLNLLPLSGAVVFFMDDQVFIREWVPTETGPGWSLRHGLHLRRCYPLGCAQDVPSITLKIERGEVSWTWAEGDGDWSYPLSLDGHIFDLAELRPMIEELAFHSPNTLESVLQTFVSEFKQRSGFCYAESRVVNVPWNRVQTDCDNRHAKGPTADEMLAHWRSGKRIDLDHVYGMIPVSCHQELPLTLEQR